VEVLSFKTADPRLMLESRNFVIVVVVVGPSMSNLEEVWALKVVCA
jgi:hypothetical protein